MESKIIFNAIKEYRASVEELYSTSDNILTSLNDATRKTIHSSAFQSYFDGLEVEKYTDVDKEVLTLLNELIKICDKTPLVNSHGETLNRYKNVLDKWDR